VGREQVTMLEDGLRLESHLDRRATRKDHVELAVHYQLLTRFTAFVLVDKAEVIEASSLPRAVVQTGGNPSTGPTSPRPAGGPSRGSPSSPGPCARSDRRDRHRTAKPAVGAPMDGRAPDCPCGGDWPIGGRRGFPRLHNGTRQAAGLDDFRHCPPARRP